VKGNSEALVREALTKLGDDMPLVWWKPPDDARNWKPADYLLWFKVPDRETTCGGYSAFIEVKATTQVHVFPIKDFRPVQVAYMRRAAELGLPYLVVIQWRRSNDWTISDGRKIARMLDAKQEEPLTSISKQTLRSLFGVDCSTAHLAGTIGAALRGELD